MSRPVRNTVTLRKRNSQESAEAERKLIVLSFVSFRREWGDLNRLLLILLVAFSLIISVASRMQIGFDYFRNTRTMINQKPQPARHKKKTGEQKSISVDWFIFDWDQ